MYAAIEAGQRKPSIDVLFTLASLYGTSMDMVYHAYYRRHLVYCEPEQELSYEMRKARTKDARYIRSHFKQPDKLPAVKNKTFQRLCEDRESLTGVNPFPKGTQ